MADLRTEIKTHLKAIKDITDLTGEGVAARIYSRKAKQGVALPYIVYHVFEGRSDEHLNGVSGTNMNRVQIDCYGSSETQSHTLAEAVRGNLQMYRGTLGAVFANNISSNGGFDYGEDNPTKGGNQRRYWTSRDYLITYTVTPAAHPNRHGPAYADQYG